MQVARSPQKAQTESITITTDVRDCRGRYHHELPIRCSNQNNDAELRIQRNCDHPTPDRLGDVIEPLGVRSKIHSSLLWQHKAMQPAGRGVCRRPKTNNFEVNRKVRRAIGCAQKDLMKHGKRQLGLQQYQSACPSIMNHGRRRDRFIKAKWRNCHSDNPKCRSARSKTGPRSITLPRPSCRETIERAFAGCGEEEACRGKVNILIPSAQGR